MPRFRTGRRRSKRTISVVPVRLSITGREDSYLPYTIDEFLEPEKQVLGVEFPEQADEYEEKD
jgi:hypothetical protein